MTGKELIDALRRSGTGEAKLELTRVFLEERPAASAQQVYDHLVDKNDEGRLDSTLAKVKAILAGRFTLPKEPNDDDKKGWPATPINIHDVDEVRRESAMAQLKKGFAELEGQERDLRKHPPAGIYPSHQSEPYARPSVEAVDQYAEDTKKSPARAPQLVPSNLYGEKQRKDEAASEETGADRKKAEKHDATHQKAEHDKAERERIEREKEEAKRKK